MVKNTTQDLKEKLVKIINDSKELTEIEKCKILAYLINAVSKK